jgi:predicted PurR-regulated permease PerM
VSKPIEPNQPNPPAPSVAVAVSHTLLPTTRTVLRVAVLVLLLWYGSKAAFWMLQKLTGVILLVVLAVFFAYLVAPLVELVRRPFRFRSHMRVMPRGLAIGIVYLVIFGSITLTIYVATPVLNDQFTQLSQQAPNYRNAVRERFGRFREAYDRRFPESVRKVVNEKIVDQLEPIGQSAFAGLINISIALLGYLPWLVLIPVLAFFILKDVDQFRVTALRMFPSGRWRWRADDFFQDLNQTLAAYTRATLIACLLIGTVCTIGFWLIGLPYALLLGVLAGLCEFIPLVGPLTVALIVTPIAGYYSFNKGIGVLIFLLVLRLVHDYVTYPRIIGRGIHLHPLAIILAILAGAELGGVAGIFLAIPVVALCSVAHQNWVEHRGSGLVAEILVANVPEVPTTTFPDPVAADCPSPVIQHDWSTVADVAGEYPSVSTTAEDMARVRPDLTTGELKLPENE